VTWTGQLAARQTGLGLKVQWSYAPGEVKVLTSSDGSNFEEAACWRSAGREDVAYGESIMFETAKAVKAVTVVMRAPQPWAYYGISFAALIADAGPAMLVSMQRATAGETCLVARQDAVGAKPCLEAVVAGKGEEGFRFTSDSQLVSAQSGRCVTASSNPSSSLHMGDCAQMSQESDGRGVFEVTPSGQLRLPELGDACVQVAPHGVFVARCAEEGVAVEGTEFAVVAAPEVNERPEAAARDVARLVAAAAARQRALLDRLKSRMSSCRHTALASNTTSFAKEQWSLASAGSAAHGDGNLVVSAVDVALGIDIDNVRQLLSETDAIAGKLEAAGGR